VFDQLKRLGNYLTLLTPGMFLSVFFVICTNPSHAQTEENIDSLKTLLAKQGNDSSRVGLMLEIGDQYAAGRNAKYDSALVYYQNALDINGKRSASRQVELKGKIAHLYLETGNLPEALQLSLDNLKAAEQLRDTFSIFFINREILFVYLSIEDFPKALEIAKKLDLLANSISPKRPERRGVFKMMVNHNLGNIYEGMNQFDSVLHYRRLEYNYSVHAKDTEGLALSTISLAEMYDKRGFADSALHYNRLCFLYAERAGRFDIATATKGNMASLFEKKGQLDSALHFAYEYYYESKNRQDSAAVMSAAQVLSDIYKGRKQFDSAYAYLSYHNQLKDQLKTEEKIQKAQNVSFNELMRKKQVEQEREQAKQEYKTKVKIYSLIIGLAIVSLFAFTLFRNNRQKHRAKLEIEEAYDELKSTQAQLIQSEKMASLGELTAGIAHEIQNPLNFVNNFSEVSSELLDEMKQELAIGNRQQASQIADDVKQNLEKIIHHGKRADGIVKGMLMHSRASSGQKEPTEINVLADEYLRLSYHGLRAKDKTFQAKFETHFDKTIEKIRVLPQDIGRVLLNLFTNAFYSVTKKNKQHPEGYEPCVSVTTKRLTDKIEIRVRDNGMGIPQKVMDKIFQPFFTTKPTGEGTGLGLSLSYDIITKGHGGELKVETKEGEFAEFIILLPIT
jgi:two-component system NtrC family sensor kinase